MPTLQPIGDLDAYISTRTSWHTLAEHVLSPARWCKTERIGLRVLHDGLGNDGLGHNGIGTPPFGDDEQLWIDADGLHHSQHGNHREVQITTVRAAAEFAGISAGAPVHIYTPTTKLALDEVLTVDTNSAAVLGDWFQFGNEALVAWQAANATETPSLVQLWPEHFDLAVDLGDTTTNVRANFGASPGDSAIPEPYLYVGPWDLSKIEGDPFWNQPWGTALTYRALLAAPNPAQAAGSFFAHGKTRLTPS